MCQLEGLGTGFRRFYRNIGERHEDISKMPTGEIPAIIPSIPVFGSCRN
jgi:hypothetical protein